MMATMGLDTPGVALISEPYDSIVASRDGELSTAPPGTKVPG
jgi:hypothetical protein